MKTRQGRYVCVVWHDLWPDRLMDRDGNSGSAQSFPSTRYQTNTVKMKCTESFHSNVSSLKPTQSLQIMLLYADVSSVSGLDLWGVQRTTTSFTILPPNLCTKTFDRSIEMLCNSHFMELFNKSFHDYLRYFLQCFGSMERMRALVWVMFIVMFSSGREGWVMWNDWRALLPITYFTIKMTSTHRTLKCLSSLPQPHFVDSLVQGDQNTCPGINLFAS